MKKWRPLIRSLEKRVLRNSSGVLIVSDFLRQDLERQYGAPCSPSVITNGFDPEEFQDVEPTAFDDTAVVYAGTFWPGYREIWPVIDAIVHANSIKSTGTPAIRLHYYGREGQHVMDVARSRNAEDFVVVHGTVPRKQALSALKGCLASVVITSVREQERRTSILGILTGKLFEAFGTGTPVLLIAPPGAEATAIVERTGGGRGFVANQVEDMARWLSELPHCANRGRYLPPQSYAWPSIALQLDRYLRDCLDRNGQNSRTM